MAASDYPNGQIPLSELAQVGYNSNGDMQYLEPTAARYWTGLVIKATSTGVISLNCLEGYRSLAEQQRLYNGYVSGTPGFNSAAYPGTSPHGYGKAVDVYSVGGFSSTKYFWLRDNAPAYGFTNTVGIQINEPWHWVFGSPTIPTGSLGVPAAIPGSIPQPAKDEDLMRFYTPYSGSASGYGLAIGNDRIVCAQDDAYTNAWIAECQQGATIQCSGDELNRILSLRGIPWGVVTEAIKPANRNKMWRAGTGFAAPAV